MTEALAAPTLADLERALDEAVSALVFLRYTPPEAVKRTKKPPKATFDVVSVQQLTETDNAILKARDLANAPIDEGLKHSIRNIGKLVYALVGNQGMEDVADRVCNRDPDNYGRRVSPIDSAWNGIGSWHS